MGRTPEKDARQDQAGGGLLRVGVIGALVAIIAFGLLFGPAGLRHEPQSAEATSLNEIKKLLASDAQADNEFGWSVAVSGDTAVVGARIADSEGVNAGAAYVFQRNQGSQDNWGQVQKLTASDAQLGDRFGASVAISSDTVIVGAIQEDDGGNAAGAAYVFQRDAGGTDNWGEVKKLVASDAEALDFFGFSVAVSADTAIVGALGEDGATTAEGAAYVFRRDEGGTSNWGEVKKLTASDAQDLDQFGISITISEDTAIVGAYAEDAGGDLAGAAYVFQRDQGGANNWGEVKKLVASDAQLGDRFGGNVTISGDTAIVGACCEDAVGASNAGAAYVFQRNQGGTDNWGEVTKLTASDAETNDSFGFSVAVSADTAIVGALGEDGATTSEGAAYVFRRDEGGTSNWGEVTKLTASDREFGDHSGYSVAISGDTAIAGAPDEDTGGAEAGAAYVFDLLQPKPTPTPTPTTTPTPTPTITPTPTPGKLPHPGDTDGDGCSDQRENGPDEGLGGLRNWLYQWDYYDVAIGGGVPGQDGVIDLPNDILGVIQHFSPLGTEPEYDVLFDRGPRITGPVWNMTAPDGLIDLPNDILGVIQQFAHTCT